MTKCGKCKENEAVWQVQNPKNQKDIKNLCDKCLSEDENCVELIDRYKFMKK